jgi:C1A family cysteine protease
MMTRGLALTAAILIAILLGIPGVLSAEEDTRFPEGYWDLSGNDRIPLIQQMIEEEGMGWTAGPTSVSNLTDAEKQRLLGCIPPEFETLRPDPAAGTKAEKDLPAVFDWRTQYKVTAARDQADCGSCWLFGPTAALESAILIYEDQRFDLSEQQILSCVSYGWGCGGGWMQYAYQHFVEYGTIEHECMPYTANHSTPCTEDECEVVAVLDDYFSVNNNVTAIKNAIYDYGPVSTGIYVFDDFFSYQDGCYDAPYIASSNHCVMICGWDDTLCDGEGAWIIKNSWNIGWGINGFGYVKYGAAGIGRAVHRLQYTAQMHDLHLDEYSVVDSRGDRNNNGFLDPGETAGLSITLANEGMGSATGVTGVLRSLTPGITVTDSVADFSDIGSRASGTTIDPHFEVVMGSGLAAGDWIDMELVVTTDTRAATLQFPVYVGSFTEVLMDDFETDQGWTVGLPDDDATEGVWERVTPTEKRWYTWVGDLVQPGKDTTPHPGSLCFVTENSPAGTKQRFGDVDGGRTTLLSPVLDLSTFQSVVLSYQRWYSNDTIPTQADDDPLEVDVTSDGGATWVNLETLEETPEDREYHQVVVDLADHVTLSDAVQVRFVAQDYGMNSVVEAVIDDVEIRGFGSLTDIAVGEPGALVAPARPVLAQNVPNPFNPETIISFGLPTGATVDLSIYNIRGQRVRRVVDGWMPAGYHREVWDGRDSHGLLVSSGVYFYRLTTPEGSLTRRMTLIK